MVSKKGGVRLTYLKAFIKKMLAIPYLNITVGTASFTVSIPTKKYIKTDSLKSF